MALRGVLAIRATNPHSADVWSSGNHKTAQSRGGAEIATNPLRRVDRHGDCMAVSGDGLSPVNPPLPLLKWVVVGRADGFGRRSEWELCRPATWLSGVPKSVLQTPR